MLSGVNGRSAAGIFRDRAQLMSIIDATIKQHDKSIGEHKRLLLKEIFRCKLV